MTSYGAALKVAVVGLGYFSQFHLRAWQRIGGVDLVGVTDTDAGKRAAAAAEYGTRAFDDTAALLDAADPDIVDIVTPPHSHAALTRAAMRRGRVVIAQKPFCGSHAVAADIADEADRANCTVVVHENFRFQPWHRETRRLLAEGLLGEVMQARFAFRPGDGRGSEAYLGRQPVFRTMKRFLVYEAGVHFLDLFRYHFGELRSIYADLRQLNPVIAGEDAATLMLEHIGGTRSMFDGNRLSDHVTDNPRRTLGEMLVEGTAASLRLDGFGRLFLRPFGTAEEARVLDRNDDPEFGGGCVEALNRHVVRHLTDGTALENKVRDYLPVLRASEAAYRSADEGRRIDLHQ